MAAHVTNICFHGIGEPLRDLEPGEERYWISQDAYMDILDAIAGRPEVRISFDDGNRSDVDLGLPGLLQHGLRATFFVLAGRIGLPGSLDRLDLRLLRLAGMRIGSHGMDHISWRDLDAGGVRRELVEAREQITMICGETVDEAALPLGRYDRATLRHLRRLGYRHVYSSDRAHAAAGAWLQPRFSVTAIDDGDSVRSQILSPQGIARRMERQAAGLVKRLR